MKIKYILFGMMVVCTSGIISRCTWSQGPEITPSAIEQIESTQFVTNTPSPSPVSVSTPIPILTTPLPPAQAVNLIIDPLLDNGGCQFPCFLGKLIPGKIEKQTVLDFISQFGQFSGEQYYIWHYPGGKDNRESMFISKTFGEFYLAIQLSFNFSGNKVPLIHFEIWPAVASGDNSGARLIGHDGFEKISAYYLIDNILNEYGKPSQVYISTYIDDDPYKDPYVPISAVLHYPKRGVLIEYVFAHIKEAEILKGCTDNLVYFTLFISDPELNYELSDYLQYESGELLYKNNLEWIKPLDEVTSLTVDEFYQFYKEPGQMKCFETPASFWRSGPP